jgi:hypothetical protein
MRINEVAAPTDQRLVALSQFLLGRATDQAGKKQISQDAFVELAQSMGINVTQPELVDLVAQDPLKNIIEPIEPNSGVVRFKGNLEKSTGMTVDKAQNIVDKNAKAAMRRGMNK